MKKILLTAGLAAITIVMLQCSQSGNRDEKEVQDEQSAGSPIRPVSMRNPGIPGFKFPESETVLDRWIQANDVRNMYLHGWGIWTALNMNSGQSVGGQNLRIFETWLTTDEIKQAIINRGENNLTDVTETKQTRGRFQVPHQFLHARKRNGIKASAMVSPDDSSRILGFVKYDPTAANFTIKNKLYDSTTLQLMLNAGKTDVPDFPNTSVTIKPVFEIISQQDLQNGYYKLNVWSGPPKKPMAYGPDQWPGCIYVDLQNRGKGNGGIDSTGRGPTPQNTYNLQDFVHFKIDPQTAQQLRSEHKLNATQTGDVAILVGMHVTSRETKRWTWQTFWWAPNADMPPLPSSQSIAASRPAQLTGAARHYAMAIAYTFITPNQPLIGGNNKGTSIYAYNPYLEAGFDSTTFQRAAMVMTNGRLVVNKFGVQTNCMSCHALAAFPSANTDYMADAYVSLNDPYFKKKLKIDFLWSIQGNLIEGKQAAVAKK
jgi:hypothetical protein